MTAAGRRPAHIGRHESNIATLNGRRGTHIPDPEDPFGMPPQDLAAERIVLGAVMADPAVADVVSPLLSSAAFFDVAHEYIYRAIVTAYAAGDPTEPVALADRLDADGDLDRVGGVDYLRECVASVPVDVNAAFYAKVVAKKAARREALAATTLLQQALLRGDPAKARTALDELTRIAAAKSQDGLADMMVDGATFVLDVPETMPVVWGRGDEVLWAEGEALMICGPSGVGKTTITGQILRGLLGLGGKVLGWEVRTARRVLYLAMDRPAQIQRALRRVFSPEERGVLAERVVFWKGPPPHDLATRPETLLEMARAANADVVIVDSLKDAAIGLADDVVGAGYNRARQAVLADGRQMLELHHVVKRGANGSVPNELADVYGSSHLVNGAGSVIMLWGNAGDPIVDFKHLKQPVNDVGPFKVLHDSQTGTSSICEGADLLELARRCPSGVTASDAACVMFTTEKPSKNEVEKARRRLERMTRQKILVQHGGGRGDGSTVKWYAAAPESWVPEEFREAA
jgi:replicative DNA helicase